MVVVAAVISISWKQQWKYPLVSGWLGWQPVMLAEHTVLLGSNWSSCVLVVPVLWYGLVLPLTVPPFLFSLTSGSSAFPLIKKTSFFFPKKFLNCLNQPEIVAVTFYQESRPVHLLKLLFPCSVLSEEGSC